MNFLKTLILITLFLNLTKKEYKASSLLFNVTQEEWSTSSSLETTHVKILCDNLVKDIGDKSKAILILNGFMPRDISIVLRQVRKSSIVAHKGLSSIDGGQRVIVEFKNKEVIIYEERLDVFENEWKLSRGISDIALKLSEKLKTNQLLYK